MNRFKNRSIQELYNFLLLNDNFDWRNFDDNPSYVIESFGNHVDKLNETDWIYFEQNLGLWESEVLEKMALIFIDYHPTDQKKVNYDYAFQKKVYCLALINCWNISDLTENLVPNLDPVVDIDSEILKKVTERLEQWLAFLPEFNTHMKYNLEFLKKVSTETTKN